jgi:two-component system LytT family sensor kinase
MLHSALTLMRSPVPRTEQSHPASGKHPSEGAISPEVLFGAPSENSPYRMGLLVFFVLTVISLIQAAQYYFFFDPNDGPVPWTHALGLGFGLWYPWGLFGLFAFRLSQRFPLGKHNWPAQLALHTWLPVCPHERSQSKHQWLKRLALHTAFCLVCAVVKIFIDYPIIRGLYCPRPEELTWPVFLRMTFAGAFLRSCLYYWTIVAVSHAVDYYGKYRDGQLRAAQLESGLTRARLQLLKTQLQPHFLFNTLNAISALIHVDVEAADRTLARLGDLLRLALEDFAVQEAPLARELEIARSYLEIEQARLGPRLSVEWDIAPDCCDAIVPTFLLQPLIENAIHHGIAPRIGPGCLILRTRRLGSELHLEVRDDGLGFRSSEVGGGVGLANTRARLLHLYGTAQRLEVTNHPQGGCVAKIVLPFRELAPERNGTTADNPVPHGSHRQVQETVDGWQVVQGDGAGK